MASFNAEDHNLHGAHNSIMSQLTISRFKGDTAFSFVSRLTSSFVGGIVGMTVWWLSIVLIVFLPLNDFILSRYISAGSGRGNPYGLAATCAIFFPVTFGICFAIISIWYAYVYASSFCSSEFIILGHPLLRSWHQLPLFWCVTFPLFYLVGVC